MEFIHCVRCKVKRATHQYDAVFFCGKTCATEFFPVHIGNTHPCQIINIPPPNLRLIRQTHREGGGIMPYRIETIRQIVQQMEGDVDAFDRAVLDSINYRRLALVNTVKDTRNSVSGLFYENDINTEFLTVKAGEYKAYRKVGASGIIPYIIPPFMRDARVFIDQAKQTSRLMLDSQMSVADKDVAFKKFLLFAGHFDEFLQHWGLFASKIVLALDDDVLIGYRSTSVTVHRLFMEAYQRLAGRYRLKPEQMVFPTIQTRYTYLATVPQNTVLYRGYADNYSLHGLSRNRTHDYFAFDFFTTAFYAASNASSQNVDEWNQQDSGVAVFQTRRAINVLDLTQAANLLYLRNQMELHGAPQDVKRYIKFAWEITEAGHVKRQSDPDSDESIVNWICSMGWDGYIGVGFVDLHDEILLCKPQDVLVMYQNLKHSSDFLNDLIIPETPEQGEAILVEY